jgi:hypothetical protein
VVGVRGLADPAQRRRRRGRRRGRAAARRRRATLLGWTGLLLGLYGLFLSGELLGRFLSSMRALAPTVLAAVLAIVAFQGTPREPPGSVKAGLPSCRDDDPYR